MSVRSDGTDEQNGIAKKLDTTNSWTSEPVDDPTINTSKINNDNLIHKPNKWVRTVDRLHCVYFSRALKQTYASPLTRDGVGGLA